jgi:hypothetical protein
MESLTKHFIKDYNIKIDSTSTIEKTLEHGISIMVHRVITLITASAMENHRTSINKEDIYKVFNNIKGKKMKIKGGESMPAEFYGYQVDGAYSVNNANIGAVNVGNIDWANGIARASQGPAMAGGGAAMAACILFANSKSIKKMIKEMIPIKISPENLKLILKELDMFLYTLGMKLKDKKLTEEKYKKMINTKKFSLLK